MYKPPSYDGATPKASGEFSRPEVGPCVLKIISAIEKQSKKDAPMLVLELDISDGEFKNYYRDMGERTGKPFYLNHYRLLTDEFAAYFKGDIKAIEESNSGFTFNFDEQTLVGKLVGGNLREEEYAKDGDIKTSLKVGHLCSVKAIQDGKVKPMKPKTLGGGSKAPTNVRAAEQRDGDPGYTDDDLPF